MAPLDGSRQQLLVTHAVLSGLTPLILIPFVDDQVYAYFLRSMVQRLAASHGQELAPQEVKMLADQPGGSCLLGCLGGMVLYPLKKIFRKIFFFLEWKRAVDTISHTYYQGYLLDAALAEGWLDTHGAARVRAAIDAVLARTNTSLVTHAVYGVVSQSKGILQGVGKSLSSYLSGVKAVPGQDKVTKVTRAVDNVQAEEGARLGSLTSQLQRALSSLPVEHFQQVRQEVAAELARPSASM